MKKPSGRPRKWSRNGIALEYGELYWPKPIDSISRAVSYGYTCTVKEPKAAYDPGDVDMMDEEWAEGEELTDVQIEDYLENSVYRDIIGDRPKPAFSTPDTVK